MGFSPTVFLAKNLEKEISVNPEDPPLSVKERDSLVFKTRAASF